MTISLQEIEVRISCFKEVCRNSGIKLTHQRIEIFREVAQSEEHPDAERIFKGVRQRIPTVSIDTVYRALWLLKEAGLIVTLGPPQGSTRFDANMTEHHHFVCIHCGLTLDFYSDSLKRIDLPETVKNIGLVKTTRVEVKGICLECSNKGQK